MGWRDFQAARLQFVTPSYAAGYFTGWVRGLHCESAIDIQDVSGDVAGAWAGEEKCGGGGIFDRAEGVEGDFAEEVLFEVVVEDVGHVGFDESWCDGIDGDATGAEFAGGGFGEADDAGFTGGVVGLAGVAHEADDRGDIDDAA